jgi:hypothetical protein
VEEKLETEVSDPYGINFELFNQGIVIHSEHAAPDPNE